MPRDLFSVGPPQDNHILITASPEIKTPQPGDIPEDSQGVDGFIIHSDDSEDSTMKKKNEEKNIHPYVQTLSLSDLESCLAVENAAFPEHHRATKEKVATFSLLPDEIIQACNETRREKGFISTLKAIAFSYFSSFDIAIHSHHRLTTPR